MVTVKIRVVIGANIVGGFNQRATLGAGDNFGARNTKENMNVGNLCRGREIRVRVPYSHG